MTSGLEFLPACFPCDDRLHPQTEGQSKPLFQLTDHAVLETQILGACHLFYPPRSCGLGLAHIPSRREERLSVPALGESRARNRSPDCSRPFRKSERFLEKLGEAGAADGFQNKVRK